MQWAVVRVTLRAELRMKLEVGLLSVPWMVLRHRQTEARLPHGGRASGGARCRVGPESSAAVHVNDVYAN